MIMLTTKGAYNVGDPVPRLQGMISERHGLTTTHMSLNSASSGVLTYLDALYAAITPDVSMV